MAFLNLNVNYIKKDNVHLIERIKKIDSNDWYYFHPEDQFLCNHIDKFKNYLPNFKQHKEVKLKLNSREIDHYYNRSGIFHFKNTDLYDEKAYKKLKIDSLSIEQHLECCSYNKIKFHSNRKIKKPIRKRKKLTKNEIISIAFDLGNGFCQSSICNQHNITPGSLRPIKKSIKSKSNYLKNKKKLKSTIKCLTKSEQEDILEIMNDKPLISLIDIKNKLGLKCSLNSIRKFLKLNKISKFVAKERPFLYQHHVNLRDKFVKQMVNVSRDVIDTIVFTDEKTVQSYSNAKIKLYRKRGLGMDKRYIIRKEKQKQLKLNLFSYLTSKGIGSLYLINTKMDAKDYVNMLKTTIIPDIINTYKSSNFIFQQDNCPIHTSNLVMQYFKESKLNVLIWPPRSPEWNLIEYCWSFLQKNLNYLILEEGSPKNETELINYCFRSWKKIDQQMVENLYNHFPKLMKSYLEIGI